MKRILSIALCGALCAATLTVEDGAITACTLTGDDETPEIGGAALVDTAGYLATILAAAQLFMACAAVFFCAPGKKSPPGRQALPGGSVRQKLRVYLKTPQRCSILPKSPICRVAFACIPPRSAALMRLASGAFWRIFQHF